MIQIEKYKHEDLIHLQNACTCSNDLFIVTAISTGDGPLYTFWINEDDLLILNHSEAMTLCTKLFRHIVNSGYGEEALNG